MSEEHGEKERAALALACSTHPEVLDFYDRLLSEMVGEDEEAWRASMERFANDELSMNGDAWVDEAEAGLEWVSYLIHDCGESPRGLLSLIHGGV